MAVEMVVVSARAPRHWLGVLVSGVLVLGLAPPGTAYHEPAGPLIARGGAAGDGWVALTIRSDGARASAEVLGYFQKLRPMVFATYLYNAEGAPRGGIEVSFGDFGASGRRVYADANVANQNIHYESHEEFDSNSYGGMSVEVQGQGVATLLLIAAGESAHWTWTFEGAPGVSLEAVATGDRAFRYIERDFRGPANVGLWNVVGAHAAADVSRSFEIGDTWIGGFFGAVNDTADRLSLTTPAGERPCSCSMLWFDGPNRAGPGTYTGHLTGAGPGNVFLWGADAHLPEPGTLLVFSGGTPGAVPSSDPVTLEGRLTDATGTPLQGAELAFELSAGDGVSASAVTDADGVASVTVTAPTQPGFYPVKVSFAGRDGGPEAASASMVLEVVA